MFYIYTTTSRQSNEATIIRSDDLMSFKTVIHVDINVGIIFV